ncbi:hypothetical protein Fot_20311 [Forsythia ovata]|uniref:RNase H type-1 domain-containing protein n=1 Tax=Forsythia ovata TaxID=205694 RepID=A0ABD1VNI7_9LAMI
MVGKKWRGSISICLPTCFGGLGYRNLELFNQALVVTQARCLVNDNNSLAALVGWIEANQSRSTGRGGSGLIQSDPSPSAPVFCTKTPALLYRCSTSKREMHVRVGAMIQYHNGVVVRPCSKHIEDIFSLEEAETLALREWMLLAKLIGVKASPMQPWIALTSCHIAQKLLT